MQLFLRSFLAVSKSKCHCARKRSNLGVSKFKWIAATLALLVLTAFAPHASAYDFFWQDSKTKASLAFPDDWRVVHNQKTDDVLTIVAPSDNEFPMCRMRIREDRRFMIYPRRYADNIQRINYSEEFWQSYIGEFRAGRLDEMHDNSGLGRGYGSYAYISFIPDASPLMKRRGLVFVGLYRDKAYIFECSAHADAFEAWAPVFLNIASTVNFRKELHQLPGGYYRHFPADKVLKIHNAGGKVDIY